MLGMPMIGRVTAQHKTRYILTAEGKEISAVVRGLFHQDAGSKHDFPKVGDYVEYAQTGDGEGVIEKTLPRRTEIARTSRARGKRDGGIATEVLVANVDVMFIVMGLDGDFSVSRAERYASLAAQSGVRAIVVLNKCDTVPDPEQYAERIRARLPRIPVHAVSAATGENMETIRHYIGADTTAVLLGSSGAGKSTMMNRLLRREQQETGDVRDDDSRGRHTTTSRELFAIPTGGYLIDTPGIRELGIAGGTEEVFGDIEMLAAQCSFTDCDHEKSAGCAIQEAIAEGTLSHEQFDNYAKLQRERAYAESKDNEESRRQYKEKRKKMTKAYAPILKQKHSEREQSSSEAG